LAQRRLQPPAPLRDVRAYFADWYLNDPKFKERMRQDPEGTAQSTGLKLDDEDRQSIKDWDMSSSGDEQLKDRISKGIALN
jgi:hypothetical protein